MALVTKPELFFAESRQRIDLRCRQHGLFQFNGNEPRPGASSIMEGPMPQQIAYIFVFDGFADWEPPSALAELRRTFGFETKAIGLSRDPVVSMGGLRVVPDLQLTEIQPH